MVKRSQRSDKAAGPLNDADPNVHVEELRVAAYVAATAVRTVNSAGHNGATKKKKAP